MRHPILKYCMVLMLLAVANLKPSDCEQKVEWEYNYDCITLPNEPWDETSPSFRLTNRTGNTRCRVTDEEVLILSGTEGVISWGLPHDAPEWDYDAEKVTVEWRSKNEDDSAFHLLFRLGAMAWILDLRNESVKIHAATYDFDTTDFHVYRLTVDTRNNIGKLYIDSNSKPVIEVVGISRSGRDWGLNFQMVGEGAVYLDYLRWTRKGLFPPCK